VVCSLTPYPPSIDANLCRVDDVSLPDAHPRKSFIIDALDKEIRLSFSKRIKGTLPEPYQALISEAKEKDVPEFKYNKDSTTFAAEGRELAQLIRKKALNEDFSPVMEKIGQDASAAGLSEPALASTDALVTALCWVGSKSLSHALACIERCKERLLTVANSSATCRKQIITSVLDFWRDQRGIGVILVDKLLNYQILTPTSVVEWALIDKVNRGTLLTHAWTYELISNTVTKVSGRVRKIVSAIRTPGMPEDQKSQLEATLATELENMKSLFATIKAAVVSIRDGSRDQMIKSSDALRAEDEELLKGCAARWARVFARRDAVEEAWVREELTRPIPEPESVEVKMEGEVKVESQGDAINGDTNGTSANIEENGVDGGDLNTIE
jgi:nuclear cap-binding protein subunit 1